MRSPLSLNDYKPVRKHMLERRVERLERVLPDKLGDPHIMMKGVDQDG